jgi:hypothetical protein
MSGSDEGAAPLGADQEAEVNLECGILIRGSHHPASIRTHLLSLKEQGILQKLP